MTHLLDTNVWIAAMRGHSSVVERLRAMAPSETGISTVSLYELYSGVERCADPEREGRKVQTVVGTVPVLPFDADAARHTASIRWHLEQQGKGIGPYDLMLAGQAVSLGVVLVTHNTAEFQRVPGLSLVDWQVDR